LMQNVLLCEC